VTVIRRRLLFRDVHMFKLLKNYINRMSIAISYQMSQNIDAETILTGAKISESTYVPIF
jgi:hypothetical protein